MNFSLRSKANIILALIVVFSLSLALFVSTRSTAQATNATSNQSDWAIYGFDPQHTHYNPNETLLSLTTVSSLQLSWTATIGGSTYQASPVVANGRAYMGGDDNQLRVFDASTGTLLWSYQTDGLIRDTPAVVNGIVYVGSGGTFYALDSATGSLLWTYPTGSSSPPVVVNGVIYFGGYQNIYALNATTGILLWSYLVGGFVYSSPAVANGIVYFTNTNGNILYALNATTGVQLWLANILQGEAFFNSSPAVANGVVYISSGSAFSGFVGHLYAFDASTGTQLWTYSLGPTNPQEPSPAVANGIVYYGGNSGPLYAFNATTGALLWTYTLPPAEGVGTAAAVANGVVYFGTNAALYALDAQTGTLLFSYNTGGNSINYAVIVGNGSIYFSTVNSTTGSGTLFALSLPNTITPTPSPSPTPQPSMTLSVSIDDISCLSSLTFSVQNAKPDQIRVSRDGQYITKLAGSAKTYTDVATGTFAGYAYALYEVAAFKSGKFLALARSYIPIDQSCFNGKTPPGYPKPPVTDSQNDLFFIVGGINSTLSANAPINSTDTQAAGNNGYGYDPAWETYDSSPRIASYLMWNGYLNSRFIMFSYNNNASTYTNDGMPKSFTCKNTFDNWTNSTFFQQEVLALSKQIQAAVAGRTNVRLHILAHSQGGLIVLTYAYALAKNLDGVTPLPAGVTLHDIDLYDSPLGGTRYNSDYLTNIILKLGCVNASKFNDVKQMHSLFLTATDKTEYGKSASIVGSFFGLNPKDPNNSNQAIAAFTNQTLVGHLPFATALPTCL